MNNPAATINRASKIRLFSFFSGLGLLDLGFEDEGFRVSYVNETHNPFLSAYKYVRRKLSIDEPEFGYFDRSITDLLCGQQNRLLAEFVAETHARGCCVGFIGGPPCPDFSVGGKNRGKDGDNGRLSHTYAELICTLRPDFFLFENVKGLWRTAKHREFYEELKETWSSHGYALAERLINAIEYSTPQDRERIVLLGFSRRVFSGFVSGAESGGNTIAFPWTRHATYPDRTAFECSWPITAPFSQDSELTEPRDLPLELTVEYWFRKNDVYSHPNAGDCFLPRAGLKRFLSVDEGDDSRKSYKRLHRWRYSPTAAYGNNEVHLHPYKARRLSVTEALAVQSLPKEFELPADMSLTDMFKGTGNGVPFLAAKMMARSIKEFIEDAEKTDGF